MQDVVDRAYQDVANAIIIRAVEDYRNALDGITYDGRLTPEKVIERVEKFFHSKYFHILTKVKPDYLIEQLRKEHYEKKRSANNESNIATSNT